MAPSPLPCHQYTTLSTDLSSASCLPTKSTKPVWVRVKALVMHARALASLNSRPQPYRRSETECSRNYACLTTGYTVQFSSCMRKFGNIICTYTTVGWVVGCEKLEEWEKRVVIHRVCALVRWWLPRDWAREVAIVARVPITVMVQRGERYSLCAQSMCVVLLVRVCVGGQGQLRVGPHANCKCALRWDAAVKPTCMPFSANNVDQFLC